jgi:hypothetical protein
VILFITLDGPVDGANVRGVLVGHLVPVGPRVTGLFVGALVLGAREGVSVDDGAFVDGAPVGARVNRVASIIRIRLLSLSAM